MSKITFITIAFLAFCFGAVCQQQSDYSDSCLKVSNFKSFDTTPTAFDIAFLQTVLENKRFVLLGEPTHQEGSVTRIKVKLVKFLHEELGFNIVAFEDSFFNLYQMGRQIRAGKLPLDLQESLSPMISENEEFKEMVDYLREAYNKGKPLIVLGFDSQIFDQNNDSLIMALSEYLGSKKLPLTETEQEFLRIELAEVSNFPHEGNPLADEGAEIKLDLLLKKIKDANDPQSADPDDLFWDHVVYLLEQTFENVRKEKCGKGEPVQNFRDRMMAETFLFLADQYKDEKIIGWGASYHFAANLNRNIHSPITDQYAAKLAEMQGESHIEPISNILSQAVTMGDILKKTYEDQLYSLAFTTAGGSYGIPGQTPIAVLPPPEGSIEYWLKKNNAAASWIDFSKGFSCTNFLAAPLGHLPIKAPWPDVFDGLFYLPEVKPLTKLAPNAEHPVFSPTVKLRGKILDVNSKSPVPFAHLMVLGRPEENSAANEAGEFEIAMEVEERDTLKISSLGFNNALVVVSEADLDGHILIELQPTSFLLEEVVVLAGGSISPDLVMKKAIAATKTNYRQQDVFLELFLRSKLYEADQLVDKKEVVIDFYSPDGYKIKSYDLRSYNNNHLAKVKHVRNFNPEKPMGIPYLDLMNVDIIGGTKGLLKLKNLKNYDFELDTMSAYDGLPVYVVTFNDKVTKAVKAYNYTSHYSGKLYINADNYAILKYEAVWERILPGDAADKANPAEIIHPNKQRFNIQTTYQEFNGSYHLKTGKISYSTSKNNQNREAMMEFLTTAVQNSTDVSDMVKFTELPIHEPPYDALFWADYNIIVDDL